MWKIFGAVRKNFSKHEKVIKYNVIDVSKIVISEEPMPPADGFGMECRKVTFCARDEKIVLNGQEAIEGNGKLEKSFQTFELDDWNVVVDKQTMEAKPDQRELVDESMATSAVFVNTQLVGIEIPKVCDKNRFIEHSVEEDVHDFEDKMGESSIQSQETMEVVDVALAFRPFELHDWDVAVDEYAIEEKSAQKMFIDGEIKREILHKDTSMDIKDVPKALDTDEIGDFAKDTKTIKDTKKAVQNFSFDECNSIDFKGEKGNPFIKNTVEILAEANNENKQEYKIDSKTFEMEFSNKLHEGYKKHRGILRYKALKHKCRKYLSFGTIKIFKKRNEKKYIQIPKCTHKDKSNSSKNYPLVENNADNHECEKNCADDKYFETYVPCNDNICVLDKVQHGKPIKCAPRSVLSNTTNCRRENVCTEIENMAYKIPTNRFDICHLQHNCKEIAAVNGCENGVLNENNILQNGKKKRKKKDKGKKGSEKEMMCEEFAETGKNGKSAKNGKKLKWFRWPRKE